MIEVKCYAVETVLKILNDAKIKKYKFSVPYPYMVSTYNLDLICVLLLKLNISVEVKEITNTTSSIEITFVTSKKVPKLKYTIHNIDGMLEYENTLKELNISDDLQPEISICLPNIIDRLCYNEC